MYFTGQKVVCVADNFRWTGSNYMAPHMPRVGTIYIIRSLSPDSTGNLGLLLEEIRNPLSQFKDGISEPSFNIIAFRPLVNKKTDISIFQRILKTRESVNVGGCSPSRQKT